MQTVCRRQPSFTNIKMCSGEFMPIKLFNKYVYFMLHPSQHITNHKKQQHRHYTGEQWCFEREAETKRSTYFGILKQGSAQSKERSRIRAADRKATLRKRKKNQPLITVTLPEWRFIFRTKCSAQIFNPTLWIIYRLGWFLLELQISCYLKCR